MKDSLKPKFDKKKTITQHTIKNNINILLKYLSHTTKYL